jgi:hypothetical protein
VEKIILALLISPLREGKKSTLTPPRRWGKGFSFHSSHALPCFFLEKGLTRIEGPRADRI